MTPDTNRQEETMITIKELHSNEFDQIISFDKFCFPTDYWKEEDWKELLADKRSIYYALLDGGRLVGNIFIYNWKGEKDYIKIMNLAIHPDYRKQGLACRLLTHAAEEMKKLDMKRFCGETRASNAAMQKAFERCGYKLDRIEEAYYDHPSESAFKYILQLS